MNLKTRNLSKILTQKYAPSETLPSTFNTSMFKGGLLSKTVLDVYRELGGKQNFPSMNIETFPLEFGKFCVILDDQLHFNRYRQTTLQSDIYEKMPFFPLENYKMYCRRFEKECLKSGVKPMLWTNPEAEKLFGSSEESGDLGMRGSSGWKLTAFIDFMQDVYAKQKSIRLLRLSVWDELMVDGRLVKLNDFLMSPNSKDGDILLNFAERKVINLYA